MSNHAPTTYRNNLFIKDAIYVALLPAEVRITTALTLCMSMYMYVYGWTFMYVIEGRALLVWYLYVWYVLCGMVLK